MTPRPDDAARAELETVVENVFHEHTHRSAHLVTLLITYMNDHAAQAAQRENEACAEIAANWEPDGSASQPSHIDGWEREQTCFHIAERIRARHAATGPGNG